MSELVSERASERARSEGGGERVSGLLRELSSSIAISFAAILVQRTRSRKPCRAANPPNHLENVGPRADVHVPNRRVQGDWALWHTGKVYV